MASLEHFQPLGPSSTMITLQQTVQTKREPPGGKLQNWLRVGFLIGACCLLIAIVLRTVGPVYGTYWSSGIAVARGMNPYQPNSLTAHSHVFALGQIHVITDLNLNPPCLLPVLQVLSYLTLRQFGIVWAVGSVLFLTATIGLLRWHCSAMQLRQLLWLGLSSAVFDTFSAGQVYFLLMLLAALAWVCAERREDFAASIALGLLVAIKPTIIFWPVFLFLSGRHKLCLRSLCVTSLAFILPAGLYGSVIYRQWVDVLRNDQHWIIATDISIPAYFARLGVRSLGVWFAGMTAAWLAYTVWKKKPSIALTSGIALCASILCAPLAWSAYTLMLAPFFVARRWRRMETMAALLLMIPSSSIALVLSSGSRLGLVAGGTPYFVAIWLILISFLQPTLRSTRPFEPPPSAVGIVTVEDPMAI
jgi:hypothetical protein